MAVFSLLDFCLVTFLVSTSLDLVCLTNKARVNSCTNHITKDTIKAISVIQTL